MRETKKHVPAIVFCVSTAISMILMQEMVKSSSAALSALLTYGLSAAFFLCTQARRFGAILNAMIGSPLKFLAMNLVSAAIVILAFESLRFVSATCYVMVFFGSTPAMSSAAQRFFGSAEDKGYNISALVLMIVSLSSGLAIELANESRSYLWILVVLMVSFFAALYMSISHDVQEYGEMTPGDIMATRFLVTVLLCLLLVLTNEQKSDFSATLFAQSVVTSMTSVVIPLYFMQMSIASIGPKVTASWFPLIPVIAFAVSVMTGGMDGSFYAYLVVAFFVGAMIWFFFK